MGLDATSKLPLPGKTKDELQGIQKYESRVCDTHGFLSPVYPVNPCFLASDTGISLLPWDSQVK